jgi:hypothetical protein
MSISYFNPENSPYSYYLSLLGKWSTNVALASQWFVYFDFSSVNALNSDLTYQLRNRESTYGSGGWSISNNSVNYLLDGGLQYSDQNMTGCVFARQVTLPSEKITAGNDGLDYGGFQAPATASSRQKYGTLNVTFLETNASFLDLIIRPWTVLVGYNGLVARDKNSSKAVKCRFADVVMLAKSGANKPMVIRKLYRFYNLAPVSIESEEYSYTQDGLKYSNVSFVYDGYLVQDVDTGKMIATDNSLIKNFVDFLGIDRRKIGGNVNENRDVDFVLTHGNVQIDKNMDTVRKEQNENKNGYIKNGSRVTDFIT